MLGWRDLSQSQRAGAVFMLFVLLFGGGVLIAFSRTVFEALQTGGGLLLAFAVVLNPASFKQQFGELISFETMPLVCRWLIYIGGSIAALGWGLKHTPGLGT